MKALIDGDILVYDIGNCKDVSHSFEALCARLDDRLVEIAEMANCRELDVFLSGSENYRNVIYPEYKANRDRSLRPEKYEEIREYLIDEWDAIVMEGMEADDGLGIHQTEDTVICTVDKDLDTIPGLHFNWSKKNIQRGVYNITDIEAARFFYLQCITGDATDNIPGYYKLTGKKAMPKIKKPLEAMDNEVDMFNYVKGLYEEYDVDYTPYALCLKILTEYPDDGDKENIPADKEEPIPVSTVQGSTEESGVNEEGSTGGQEV